MDTPRDRRRSERRGRGSARAQRPARALLGRHRPRGVPAFPQTLPGKVRAPRPAVPLRLIRRNAILRDRPPHRSLRKPVTKSAAFSRRDPFDGKAARPDDRKA